MAEPQILTRRERVSIGNDKIILAVILVGDNIQLYDNRELINRLHPRDKDRIGELLVKIANTDFRSIIL